MPSNRTVSFGLFCAALIGTIVCMAFSAAGMKDETFMVFVFTMIFVLFGFIFALMNAQDEKALAEKRLKTGSFPLVQGAIEAMEEYEQAIGTGQPADVCEQKREAFGSKAVRAVVQLGEVSVTPRETAMASTARAVEAFWRLQGLSGDTPQDEADALQKHCEELACLAIRDIRAMQESGNPPPAKGEEPTI